MTDYSPVAGQATAAALTPGSDRRASVGSKAQLVNRFIRRQRFVVDSTATFKTSQRRKFLRRVYDYARCLGLSKREAELHVIQARRICGEQQYDSDVSALENEIDDSTKTLRKLSANFPKLSRPDAPDVEPVVETSALTIANDPSLATGSRGLAEYQKGNKLVESGGLGSHPENNVLLYNEVGENPEDRLPVKKKSPRGRKQEAHKRKSSGQGRPKSKFQEEKEKRVDWFKQLQDSMQETDIALLTQRRAEEQERKAARKRKALGRKPKGFERNSGKGEKRKKVDLGDKKKKKKQKRECGVAEVGALGPVAQSSDLVIKPLVATNEDQLVIAEDRMEYAVEDQHAKEDLHCRTISGSLEAAGSSDQRMDIQPQWTDYRPEIRFTALNQIEREKSPQALRQTCQTVPLAYQNPTPMSQPLPQTSQPLSQTSLQERNLARPFPEANPFSLSPAMASSSFGSELGQDTWLNGMKVMMEQAMGRKSTTTKSSQYFSPEKPRPSSSESPRKSTSKESSYFDLKASDKKSSLEFPKLDAPSFGLIQESLADNPFRLLMAVTFLNKTTGVAALPVINRIFELFPTPHAIAAAKTEEILPLIRCLGLQNKRAKMVIDFAQAWIDKPPEKDKRYRHLNYPSHGDGRDISKLEQPIRDDDEDLRVAWEIAHLPGVGAYALDSWRIFCRDELRGKPRGLEPLGSSHPESLAQEWTRVVPGDKELCAYLRWRWLRLGYLWSPRRTAAGGESGADNDIGGGGSCGIIAFDKIKIHFSTVRELEEGGRPKLLGFRNPWYKSAVHAGDDDIDDDKDDETIDICADREMMIEGDL